LNKKKIILLFLDESETTTSFLLQLSTWDKEELDEKLANRVQVSKRAVAKVIQAFDRLMQRNEKITLALKGELDGGKKPFKSFTY
jgi:E3 ubiquitin-protein ligase BRE1